MAAGCLLLYPHGNLLETALLGVRVHGNARENENAREKRGMVETAAAPVLRTEVLRTQQDSLLHCMPAAL